MAPEDRRTRAPLSEELFSRSGRFAFDQATKLIEQMMPGQRPVGEDAPPGSEAVRYRARLGLDFPAGDIEKLEPPTAEGDPAEMTVSIMGLAGYQGPLPLWLTELMAQRERRGDSAARDFLDLFNHRLISLLYRSRRTLRVALTTHPHADLEIIQLLFSLLGLGSPGARRELPFDAAQLLPFTGLFLPTPRSLVGLERILASYFQLPVETHSLVGSWYRLEESQVTRLGRSGQNQRLGSEAVLGRRVWDQHARLELRVGPMDFERFCELLPIGRRFSAFIAMVRLYAGAEQEALLRLVVRADQIPRSVLTARSGPRHSRPARNGNFGLRLGWTSWLRTRDAPADDDQVCLRTNSAPPKSHSAETPWATLRL